MIWPDCVIGKMKRHAWRSKALPGTIRKKSAALPSDMVSVDQLVSKQPGLIPRRVDGNIKELLIIVEQEPITKVKL